MSTIYGTNKSDALDGTAADDLIVAGNGADTVNAGDGDDLVFSGNGADEVYSGAGDDVVFSGNGSDEVYAGDGDDLVCAGRGDDVIDAGAGNDIVYGGKGDDTVIHVASDNLDSWDVYFGDKGEDILRLVVTQAVFSSAAFQTDLAFYQSMIATTGSATGVWSSLGIEIHSFEAIEVIVEGNSAPTASAVDLGAINEDGSLVIAEADLLAGASDADGDTLTIASLTIQSGGGTLTDNGNGTWTYDPAENDDTGVTFAYTVTDGTEEASSTASLDLTPINDPPTASDGSGSTNEDTALSGTLPAATDVDGDTVTYSAGSVVPANGSVVVNSDGTFTYTPSDDFNGDDTFTYIVDDGKGGSNEYLFTVTVIPDNDDPVANNDLVRTIEGTAVTIDVLANDSDVDDATLSITNVTGVEPGATASVQGETIVYTPAAGFTGIDTFTYTIEDDEGAADTATVTVEVLKVVESDSAAVVIIAGVAAEFVVGNALGNIINPGLGADIVDGGGGIDTYQGTLEELDGDVITSFEAGEALVVLGATFTIDDLTFTAGSVIIDFPDGQRTTLQGVSGQAVEQELIVVRPIVGVPGGGTIIGIDPLPDDPLLAPYSNNDAVVVAEDGSETFDPIANDAIPSGSTITGLVVNAAQNGTVVANPDGTITYTPDANFNGIDYFTYDVTTSGLVDQNYTGTVAVTVTPENDAPSVAGETRTTVEDTPLTGTLPVATDIDGDALTYSLGSDGSNGTAVVTANGTFSYTPDLNFFGTDVFTFVVSDGNGGFGIANITMNVTPDNDPPVANDDSATVNEDDIVFIQVLDNDTDVEGGSLSLVSVSDPANGGTFINGANILYQPDANFSGTDTFTYTMRDTQGLTSTATVTVTVAPVNDDPVAVDDTYTVQEDTDLTVTFAELLANDTDVEGDTLTIIGVSGASGGAVSIDPVAETITFDTGLNFNGAGGFDYTVDDGNGGTDTGRVTVNVTPENDPPFAIQDSATTQQGDAVTIDILGNDLDFDGDTLVFLGFSGVDNGLAAYNGDGTMTFTPDADFVGVETFNYGITDGAAAAQGTVTVTVEEAPLTATDFGITMSDQVPLTFNALTPVTGANGTLSIISITQPTNAIVDDNGDGTFSVEYTGPAIAEGLRGSFSFDYTVSDGAGGEDTATVDVIVTNPADGNLAPIAGDDVFVVAPGGVLGDLEPLILSNDIDPDQAYVTPSGGSGFVTVLTFDQPDQGGIDGQANGLPAYFAPSGSFGVDTFTYTVVDIPGGTAIGTVTIIDSTSPIALLDDHAELAVGETSTTVTVTDNDVVQTGDQLTLISVTQGSAGFVNPISGAGSIDIQYFLTDPNFVGTDTFTYTARNSAGAQQTATVSIEIGGANNAPVTYKDVVLLEGGERVAAFDFLSNDVDADGDALEFVSFSGLDFGTIDFDQSVSNVAIFTANPGEFGGRTVQYEIQDENGATATGEIEFLLFA